jgi:hypothetical protein
MKKYNLTIFSPTGNINTSVTASSFAVKYNLIYFYDNSDDLISVFPVSMTAIISILKNE